MHLSCLLYMVSWHGCDRAFSGAGARARTPDTQTLSPCIVFGRPALGQEEIDEVVDALRSGWIGIGPRVRAFESMFAVYVGRGMRCAQTRARQGSTSRF